jgi:hypothetical protein
LLDGNFSFAFIVFGIFDERDSFLAWRVQENNGANPIYNKNFALNKTTSIFTFDL